MNNEVLKEVFKEYSFLIKAILLFSIIGICMVSSVIALPDGASATKIKSGSYNVAINASNMSAIAGNVTEVNLYGISTTSTWQGFYGNVSGSIQLADANDKVFYNWSLASPRGQVYVTTNSTVQWVYTQCFNYTAVGDHTSDIAQAGATSLYGTNLTQLESMFGVNSGDSDGINATFNLKGASTHEAFSVGNLPFGAGQCMSTRVYSNAGKGEDNKFEEVLLYEPQTTSIIFTTLLNQDVAGFDSATHDFETLVLENGHSGDTSSTPYYFFTELQ